VANSKAIEKCISGGGEAWASEEIPETQASMDPFFDWVSLETWYKENCGTWVGLLEGIEDQVDIYNQWEHSQSDRSPEEIDPSLAAFAEGMSMPGDTVSALSIPTTVFDPPNPYLDAIVKSQAELEALYADFEFNIKQSYDIRTGAGLMAASASPIANWLDKRNDTEAEATEKRRQLANQKAILEGRAEDASTPDFSYLVFKEQCFLLTKIFEIVRYKKDIMESGAPEMAEYTTPKRLPYNGTSDGSNASIQIEGDPFNFINLLTQDSNLGALFNMKTEEISSLQPQIRLFKITVDSTTGEEIQQEYMFDAYATQADVNSVFTNKAQRGFGVGIKDFSFTYDGNNPFAAKKSIKAKLTIFANSFGELLTDRGGYMYADLALKTGGTTEPASPCAEDEGATQFTLNQITNNLYKLNYRLKAVIGWARPSGDETLFTSTSASGRKTILDALNESFITLNLTPTLHEFNIDDQGRVNFVVNFLAYTEDFFDQPQFNIFYSTESTRLMMGRKLLYDVLRKECSAEKLAEVKKADAERGIVAKEKSLSMKSLISRMCDADKIRYIPLSYKDLMNFRLSGPFFTSEEGPLEIGNASDSLASFDGRLEAEYIEKLSQTDAVSLTPEESQTRKEIISIILEANNPNINHLSFFYVSDLLDIILESIDEYLKDYSYSGAAWDELVESLEQSEPEFARYTSTISCQIQQEKEALTRFHKNFKKFRAVLGPLEIADPRGATSSQFISLGDIPVSLKYFVEWLNTKMTKNEESTYFLGRFLPDFFNNLINNFLNDDSCFSGFNVKQRIVVNNALVTSYPSKPPKDEMTDMLLEQSARALELGRGHRARIFTTDLEKLGRPLLNISGPRGEPETFGPVGDEINYLIFSAGRTRRAGDLTGNRVIDEQAGIFHYVLGRPRGIVKSINLHRATPKYLKEVRYVQDGFDGLQQLREQYNATIECYANVRVLPGTYIFVDPRGWAPDTNIEPCNIKNLSDYGVGGYFMVYRAESTFGPGQADTTLYAQWVQQIESTDSKCNLSLPKNIGDGDDALICKDIATNRTARLEGAEEEKEEKDDVDQPPSAIWWSVAAAQKIAAAIKAKGAADREAKKAPGEIP